MPFVQQFDNAFIPYLGNGIFGSNFVLKKGHLEETFERFLDFSNEFINKVSEQELNKAKALLIN